MHYAILAASKRNKAPQETTANGNSTLCSRSLRSDSFVCAGWPASDFDTLTRLAQFGGAMIAVSFRGARAFRHKLLIHPLCAGLHSAACMCVSLSVFCVCESWTLLFPSHSTIGPNFEPRTVSAPAPRGARLPRNSWFVLR